MRGTPNWLLQTLQQTTYHLHHCIYKVLHCWKISGTILQTALCYLKLIQSKIARLLSSERQGLGVKGEPTPASQIVPTTEAKIKYHWCIQPLHA